jgi:hypothetical protein
MIFSEYHQRAVNLLAKGYAEDFAEYVTQDDKFCERLMELSEKYVQRNIPIVDEDAQLELALSLVERLDLCANR